MISLRSDSSLIDIEGLYTKLQTSEASEIRLPIHLKHGGTFGITSAIVQLVSTWARNNPNGRLSPYGSNSGVESYIELLQQPHGLIACYMAPHLVDSKGTEFKKHEILVQATRYIEAMQSSKFRQTMKGRGATLTCFAGAKNEFLSPLYERNNLEGMRGVGDFEDLAKKLVEVCDPSALRNMPDTFTQSLGLLIRELFENTNDHATSNEYGRKYTWDFPNVRGILAKYISFAPNSKDATSNEAIASFADAPHRIFFQRAIINSKEDKTINFIELTVLDSGPGIAKRWLAHLNSNENIGNVSIEVEEKLVRETFELGKTSKLINGTGVGLDTVILCLNRLKSLLRLRTGRLCLYQDFSSGNNRSFEPIHWLRDKRELSRTEGTSFSILIPISSKV